MPHALRLRTTTPTHLVSVPTARAERGLRGWWARNVVAMDPHPESGLLDQLDRETPARFGPAPLDDLSRRVA
ncbi:hypothetical protein V3N99_09700 [Dermatophilaceae bacterium Soc4.6]